MSIRNETTFTSGTTSKLDMRSIIAARTITRMSMIAERMCHERVLSRQLAIFCTMSLTDLVIPVNWCVHYDRRETYMNVRSQTASIPRTTVEHKARTIIATRTVTLSQIVQRMSHVQILSRHLPLFAL
jgi:hypothetical protein